MRFDSLESMRHSWGAIHLFQLRRFDSREQYAASAVFILLIISVFFKVERHDTRMLLVKEMVRVIRVIRELEN